MAGNRASRVGRRLVRSLVIGTVGSLLVLAGILLLPTSMPWWGSSFLTSERSRGMYCGHLDDWLTRVDELRSLGRTRVHFAATLDRERSWQWQAVIPDDARPIEGAPAWAISEFREHVLPTPRRAQPLDVCAEGWPFRAVRGVSRPWPGGARGMGSMTLPGWLVRAVGCRASVPVTPIWGGLVGNGLAFSCAWLGLLAARDLGLGALRRRRGRCAGCGYDLRGLGEGAPCPECGAARDGRRGVRR